MVQYLLHFRNARGIFFVFGFFSRIPGMRHNFPNETKSGFPFMWFSTLTTIFHLCTQSVDNNHVSGQRGPDNVYWASAPPRWTCGFLSKSWVKWLLDAINWQLLSSSSVLWWCAQQLIGGPNTFAMVLDGNWEMFVCGFVRVLWWWMCNLC